MRSRYVDLPERVYHRKSGRTEKKQFSWLGPKPRPSAEQDVCILPVIQEHLPKDLWFGGGPTASVNSLGFRLWAGSSKELPQ